MAEAAQVLWIVSPEGEKPALLASTYAVVDQIGVAPARYRSRLMHPAGAGRAEPGDVFAERRTRPVAVV